MAAITDYQKSEIMRKAQSGEQLLAPTTEKMALYNQYKQPTSSVNSSIQSKGITDYQMGEIIRKAQSGVQLDKPTAEKNAIYNQYANVPLPGQQSQGNFANDYLSQLNAIYDQQRQAQLQQYTAQRDKSIGQINQQKAELAPAYADKRNQADVVNAQNVQKLRELMAANGLSGSGENVTSQTALGSARQGALSQLNLQEQQQRNDYDRRISDLNDPSELNAMMAALEADRMRATADAQRYANEQSYQRERDSVEDGWRQNQWNYQAGRDQIGDNRYNQQFGYQQQRDQVGDSQWNKQFDNQNSQWQQQFNYQKDRDKSSDNQWQQQFNQNNKQYADDVAWRQYTYNNMSASERASMDRAASQFGEEMAWRMYSLEYQGELDKSMSESQIEAYKNGNFNQGAGTGYLSQAEFGSLSRKYESNGNPGTIARTKGDLGGASYGSYQLTTSSGHAQKFANNYGGALKGLKAGTTAFDNAWKAEASKNSKAFSSAQHSYIQSNHYEPAAKRFQSITGIKLDTMPKAVKDMIWSIGVQHGAGGAANIFKNSGVKTGMNAATVITKVYKERMKVNKYFSSSPQNIKNSVLKRFRNEMNDALNMLS